MDCSMEGQNISMPPGNSFVPRTELDYLLLGCLLESQQNSPAQSSPNTVRACSMYQRQFENHKKKFDNPPMRFNNYSVPMYHNSGQTLPNHKLFQFNVPQNVTPKNPPRTFNAPMEISNIVSNSERKEKKKPKRPNKVKPQGCEWCKVNSSPVWRGGPSGKGSLCNACGLQYMKGFTMERAKETLRKSRGDWKVNSQL